MSIREIKIQVRGVIERDGDLFHAYAPDLKGVHACGSTPEEAAKGLHEGISYYFMSLAKHNEPMPVGLITLDREHSSDLAMAWTLLKEQVKEQFLGSKKRKKYIEEVTLPTREGALATC